MSHVYFITRAGDGAVPPPAPAGGAEGAAPAVGPAGPVQRQRAPGDHQPVPSLPPSDGARPAAERRLSAPEHRQGPQPAAENHVLNKK